MLSLHTSLVDITFCGAVNFSLFLLYRDIQQRLTFLLAATLGGFAFQKKLLRGRGLVWNSATIREGGSDTQPTFSRMVPSLACLCLP